MMTPETMRARKAGRPPFGSIVELVVLDIGFILGSLFGVDD